MKIKYKEKPSKETIDRFCNKIEEFLSSHQLKITVELWDKVLGPLDSFVNGVHKERRYLWIKKCKITTPEIIEGLEIRLLESGFPEDMTDRWIWLQAHQIQGTLYSYLKKDPGNPRDKKSYWDLWDKHPNKTNAS